MRRPTELILFALLSFSGKFYGQANPENPVSSLPRTLSPTFYNLSLVLNPEGEDYIGTVNITFDVLDGQKVKNIYLNVDPNYLYIQDVLINNMYRPRVGTPNEEKILDVNFTIGISGEDNHIYISFIGKYSTEDYGLVQTNYTVDDRDLFKIESKFETGYAARAFPCMDETDLTANFALEIQHPFNYTALSNTEIISQDCTTSVIITKYATTEKIDPDSLYILIVDYTENITSPRAVLSTVTQCDDPNDTTTEETVTNSDDGYFWEIKILQE